MENEQDYMHIEEAEEDVPEDEEADMEYQSVSDKISKEPIGFDMYEKMSMQSQAFDSNNYSTALRH